VSRDKPQGRDAKTGAGDNAVIKDADMEKVAGGRGRHIQLQSWHTCGDVYGEAWCRDRDIDPNQRF